MKKLSKSRSGQFQNYALIVVFLFVFGFTTILGSLIYEETIDAYNATGFLDADDEVSNKMIEDYRFSINILDSIVVVVLIVLMIGLMFTSFKLKSSPLFFVYTVIVAPFFLFVSYFLNHVFYSLVTDAAFASVIDTFPNTVLIGTNLHWVALTAVVIGSITLYAKRDSGTEGLV